MLQITEEKQEVFMSLKKVAEICGFKDYKNLHKKYKAYNHGAVNPDHGAVNPITNSIDNKLKTAQKNKVEALFDLDEVLFFVEEVVGNPTLAGILRTNVKPVDVNQALGTMLKTTLEHNNKINLLIDAVSNLSQNQIQYFDKIGSISQATYQLQQIELSKSRKDHEEKINNIKKLIHLKVLNYVDLTGQEHMKVYGSLYGEFTAKTGIQITATNGESKLSTLEKYDKDNFTNYCEILLKLIEDKINNYMAFATDLKTKVENRELKQQIEELTAQVRRLSIPRQPRQI